MKTTKLIILICAISLNTVYAQENGENGNSQVVKGSSLELQHIQVIPIKDTKTDRDYELLIKLPEDYLENKDVQYPVIYFTDAMWHVEILSASTEYMLEDVILVGISWQKELKGELGKLGAHASRYRDYSIQGAEDADVQAKYNLGQANRHLEFIRNNVINYIDNNYRTDADSRTYFGYSMGGEFGAYILLTQPSTFDNYILGSPSIKNEIPYLTELNSKIGSFESNKDNSLNANVFISIGSLEKEMEAPIEELIELLKGRRDDGLSLQKEVIDGTHESAFPMTAVRSIAWLSTLISEVSSSNTELSFIDIPQLNKAFIKTAPEDRKDGVVVGELGIDGGNKEMIVKFAREIANGEHGRFNSFLIAHKGELIFESYYKRGRINIPHFQASATKAYTGLLLGRAIQLGYLSMDDLDKPLISFLKDLDPTNFVAGAEKITLTQALTMRSGIRISEEQREEMNKNPDQLKGQGRVQALLEHSESITEASQVFKYAEGAELTMQVIEAVVPGTAMDFIKNEFLDKLGITNYHWRINKRTGLPVAGGRTEMTSRDMMKLGTLAKNKGKWNSEQLIPEAFITRAIAPLLYTDDDYEVHYGGKDVSNQGYGYFWWNAELKSGNNTYYSSSAQGGWGQFIILIEELDLIVVFTGLDNDTNYLQLTAERILPAFIK